jgi:hypothetical protein
MMHAVLEESVEGFVARFRSSAAAVTLTGRVEGSPLLECVVAGQAVHVFERTGPYLAWSGPARVILHLECDGIERLEPGETPPRLDVVGVSTLSAEGVVVSSEAPFLVVDAGAPLVVGITGPFPDVAVGDRVRLASRPPVHGFVLPRSPGGLARSPDDQV